MSPTTIEGVELTDMPQTRDFELACPFTPAGDQPNAIDSLCRGLDEGTRAQVLLGVTGSGKTFTMANIIARQNRPAILLAPNKTLAAQLYSEMKVMFPRNAVEYFVSYYDYYQPEAYLPGSDTFIEKDAAINPQIEQLRLGTTKSLLERRDVVVVASVSAIYGLGDPSHYRDSRIPLQVGENYPIEGLARQLAQLQYRRNRLQLKRGDFFIRGELVDIFPAEEENQFLRLSFFGDQLQSMTFIDPVTGVVNATPSDYVLYPRTHYVTAQQQLEYSITAIQEELVSARHALLQAGKLLEAQRLTQRTELDLEMLKELGYCNGIENYSRYMAARGAGDPPPTLLEYFPTDGLLFIDESHVTLPQLRAMFHGDRARKSVLVSHGFRLPSAFDNRPLKFEEFEVLRPQTIFVSATPGPYELERSQGAIIEQVVRPTGLLDPEIEIRPTQYQIPDLLDEVRARCCRDERVCILTLTKRMSEDLATYLVEQGIKARYLHSEIDTIERVEILRDLRLGIFDVLIGINLLREGLDLPEVSLICILDADKEGFLRSTGALIQMIGRVARHICGRAILYADNMTPSMKAAISETNRRRATQHKYNEQHGIIPASVSKAIRASLQDEVAQRLETEKEAEENSDCTPERSKNILELEQKMKLHAERLEFELALKIRNQIQEWTHPIKHPMASPKNSSQARKRRRQ